MTSTTERPVIHLAVVAAPDHGKRTAAILDRLLHRCDVVSIAGRPTG